MTGPDVVKLGGRAQSDPSLISAIARRWRRAPGTLCIVHGGGDEVSALQRAMGHEPRFNGGRRVTASGDLELLRMALSGSANKRLVSALVAAGIAAVGVSGEDAGCIRASLAADSDLGRVGTQCTVDARLLRLLLEAGYLPVVSPLAADAAGGSEPLNVNGDDAASAIAAALGSAELLFVSDVAAVRDGNAPLTVIDAAGAARLAASGAVEGGMLAKLDAACAAVRAGVRRVTIGSLSLLDDSTQGTQVVPSRSAA